MDARRNSVYNPSTNQEIALIRKVIKKIESNRGACDSDNINDESLDIDVIEEQLTVNRKKYFIRRVFLSHHQYKVGWVVDYDLHLCMRCDKDFSWFRGRLKHHCRACGDLCCHDCSPYITEVPYLQEEKGSRVCKKCFGLKSDSPAIIAPIISSLPPQQQVSKVIDMPVTQLFNDDTDTTGTFSSSVRRRSIISNRKPYLSSEENLLKKYNDELERFESEQSFKYEEAYRMMRELVPVDIYKSNINLLLEYGLPLPAANRIWNMKILWLIVTHPEDIAKIHLADFRSKYHYDSLDIIEMRAVWYVLPKWHGEEKKKAWREGFKSKLDDLAYREAKGSLSANLIRHVAYEECVLLHLFDPMIEVYPRFHRIASYAQDAPLDSPVPPPPATTTGDVGRYINQLTLDLDEKEDIKTRQKEMKYQTLLEEINASDAPLTLLDDDISSLGLGSDLPSLEVTPASYAQPSNSSGAVEDRGSGSRWSIPRQSQQHAQAQAAPLTPSRQVVANNINSINSIKPQSRKQQQLPGVIDTDTHSHHSNSYSNKSTPMNKVKDKDQDQDKGNNKEYDRHKAREEFFASRRTSFRRTPTARYGTNTSQSQSQSQSQSNNASPLRPRQSAANSVVAGEGGGERDSNSLSSLSTTRSQAAANAALIAAAAALPPAPLSSAAIGGVKVGAGSSASDPIFITTATATTVDATKDSSAAVDSVATNCTDKRWSDNSKSKNKQLSLDVTSSIQSNLASYNTSPQVPLSPAVVKKAVTPIRYLAPPQVVKVKNKAAEEEEDEYQFISQSVGLVPTPTPPAAVAAPIAAAAQEEEATVDDSTFATAIKTALLEGDVSVAVAILDTQSLSSILPSEDSHQIFLYHAALIQDDASQEVMLYLIDEEVIDIDFIIDSSTNQSLLHHTVIHNQPNLARELLTRGANILLMDNDNECPLSFALRLQRVWLVEEFERTGAESSFLSSTDTQGRFQYIMYYLLAGYGKKAMKLHAQGFVSVTAEEATELLQSCTGHFDQMKEPVETYELLMSLGANMD